MSQCDEQTNNLALLLIQATGKEFTISADSKLGDLLAMELHLYAEACAEIVDRAHKELIIEKQISKIESTWAMLSLTFAPYQACLSYRSTNFIGTEDKS